MSKEPKKIETMEEFVRMFGSAESIVKSDIRYADRLANPDFFSVIRITEDSQDDFRPLLNENPTKKESESSK